MSKEENSVRLKFTINRIKTMARRIFDSEEEALEFLQLTETR